MYSGCIFHFFGRVLFADGHGGQYCEGPQLGEIVMRASNAAQRESHLVRDGDWICFDHFEQVALRFRRNGVAVLDHTVRLGHYMILRHNSL